MLPSLSALSIESTGVKTDPLFKKQLAERQKAAKKAEKERQRAEPKPGVKKPPRGGGGSGRGGGADPSNNSWEWVDDDVQDDAPGAERKRSVDEVVRAYLEKIRREQAPRRETVPSPPPTPIPESQMDSPPPTPPPPSEEESEMWEEFIRLRALQRESQAEKQRVLEQKEAEREREMEEPRKEYERLEAERKAYLERRKAAARAAREAEYADQRGGLQGPDAVDVQQEFEDYEPPGNR